MNPASQDILTLLAAESGLELTAGTDLFIGQEPEDPDNCVTIYDTPGGASQLTMAKGEDYHYPTVQVRVRNRSYETGWALIQDIKTLLHGKGGDTINSTFYSVITCSSGPFMLDRDDSNRVRFVANFDIQRR